jgi:alkylation response protein AidB-like acyl-CoA dehydrogenase
MRQPGIDVRPIRQLTGTAEFNEVYFDDARATDVVGTPGDGWRIAMATLGFERGVATIGQQIGFRRELDALIDLAKSNKTIKDPIIRDRLTRAWLELDVMRSYALEGSAEPSVTKLVWANWHQRLGELAMAIRGRAGILIEEGHALLQDKIVVVAAAAGTGIGSAAARRCLTEGAQVMISDHRARRLAET